MGATPAPPLAQRRLAGGGDGRRLGLALAGPRRYGGSVEDAWMGAGAPRPRAPTSRRALRLLRAGTLLLGALLAAALALTLFA